MKSKRIQGLALAFVLVVGLVLMAALLLGAWSSNVQALEGPESGVQEPHVAEVGAQVFTPTWATGPPVDSHGFVGPHTSLALDADNNPHISYYGNYSLLYARWTGSEWVSQTVDNSGTVGQYTSLALDGDGNPHISYYDDTNEDLKYAHRTGSDWDRQTVDEGENTGKWTSLALDGGGNPHISYHSDGDLKYARWTGSEWVSETAKSGVYLGTRTSLALDGDDYPHISYFDNINWNLLYSKWTGSTWWSDGVDTAGLVGSYSSIVLDDEDLPHISYYHNDDKELKYASRTGGDWNIKTVDGGYKVGQYTSLAHDDDGKPHISYYDEPGKNLKYAHKMGTEWVKQTVDGGEDVDVGKWTSLALDGDGRPRISYHDASKGDLKFAWMEKEGTIPTSGGKFAAYGLTQFDFPSGAVTEEVDLTYTVLEPVGSQPHVGVFFELTAVTSGSGQPADMAPGKTYQVVVHYDEDALPGGLDESTLMLFYWDGSDWVEEPSSVVDGEADTVSATADQFGVWAVLGQTGGADYMTYLPIVLRNY